MRLWMYGELMSVLAVLSLALALFLGASAHAEGPVTNAPDPEHGKVLAERVCSGCHLVSDSQTSAVVDVPTFVEIANKPGQTRGAVMARIIIPKHPMPVIPITKLELNNLSAYIMSLRNE